MRILVVEDEIHLSEALSQILKKNNYTVDVVHDGEDGLDNALSGIYDILLTAKGDISDKVKGLDTGADDYLAKPFATEELLARIRALSRRKSEVITDNTLKIGSMELNPATLKLSMGDKEIKLILKESELLELLIIRKNAVTSKELIIEKIWGFDSEVEHNHVEVYISFLRKKLLFLDGDVEIKTIRGAGYILEVKK